MTHCAFSTYLEEALRDRFDCGLRSEAMQRRLLAESELSFTKAMELAQSTETAERNTRAFKGTDQAVIKKNSRQTQSTPTSTKTMH